MKSKQKPYVITIAAVSGGGKTAVTHRLANTLGNSKALYFDDYEYEDEPEDICTRVEEGANSNDLDMIRTTKLYSDFVVDGSLPLDTIVDAIVETIIKTRREGV